MGIWAMPSGLGPLGKNGLLDNIVMNNRLT